MRRTLASLTVAAAAAVALTGCVIAPPILDPYSFGFAGGYGPYDPAYDDFDPVAEEQWQAEQQTRVEFDGARFSEGFDSRPWRTKPVRLHTRPWRAP